MASAETDSDLKMMSAVTGEFTTGTGSSGGGDENAESPGANFDDDFDIPPINLPQSALEEQQQQQSYSNNGYYQQQQQQQQMYQNQQYQQQQQWQQQQQQYGNMQNGYYGGGGEYNNGYNQQQGGGAWNSYGGASASGTSMGGAPDTPSPTGHSEDGSESNPDPHVRNNNVLKRPAPDSYMAGAQGMHPHHAHYHAHYGGHAHPMHTHPYHHHHAHHHHLPSVMPKKPKVSKRKKKRDPNEPQKPVSAYALFFRDTQASIKAANPNAAFGDVSKIVASMWDNLDPDAKAAYKKRTENAKKDYLKKLAAYRASLVSKGTADGIGYGYPPFGYAAGHASSLGMGAGQENSMQKAAGGGYGYMGQPIPPRPPMQHAPPTMGGGGAPGMHPHHHQGYNMMQHGGQVIFLLACLRTCLTFVTHTRGGP